MKDFKVYQASGVINNFYDQATNVSTKNYSTDSGSLVHIENSIYAPVKEIVVTIEASQLGSGIPSPDNIRPIKVWHDIHIYVSGADTSNPAVYTVPILSEDMTPDRDVVGGIITIKDNGDIEIIRNRVCNTFHPDGWSWNWSYYSQGDYFRSSQVSTVTINSAHCNMLDHAPNISSISDLQIATTGANPCRLAVKDASLNGDITQFNQKYADGMIYWTPRNTTYYDVITGAPEIFTLSGVTNIWSDAGDVSVTYQSI